MTHADRGRAAPALVAAAVALLYLRTLAPGITFGGDCGELATAAWCLGVPHPTGYPLYLLLARLAIALLPWGEVAWRVAVLSALAAGLACGLVCRIAQRLSGSTAAGVFAGVALACAPAFWSQAVLAEVYALQLALTAAVLAALIEWQASRDSRWLNLAGLALGLGLCNHATTVLLLPGVAAFAALAPAADGPAGLRAVALRLLRLAGWAAACLPLYAYLPLRALARPPLAVGRTDTLAGFVAHVTGRSYEANLGTAGGAEMLRYAGNHLLFAAYDLRWAAVLAVLGALVLFRRRAAAFWLLGLTAAAVLGFAAAYRVGDRANYVLPLLLCAAVAAGMGGAWLAERLAARAGEADRAAVRRLLGALLVLLPLLPAPPDGGAALRAGWDRASLAGNRRAPELAAEVLREVPPRGAVVTICDELGYALWYEQLVRGQRQDVTVYCLGRLDTPRSRARLDEILAAEMPRRNVYTAFYDAELGSRFWLVPEGAACRVLPGGTAPPVELGGLRSDGGQPVPGQSAWGWAAADLDSPVTVRAVRAGKESRLPALKPRTVGRLRVQWVARQPASGAWQVLLLLRHESLLSRATGAAVVNDSSGQERRWWVRRLAFAPTATGFEVGPGRVVGDAYPVDLPARSLPGSYEVRLGLLPAAEEAAWRQVATDPEAAARASAAIGEVVSWER
ncbi:MAG: DUF2723 domain-containing protein [Armatimonadetes bacterium]|nr:DUF2723 domain-containing protein [Armatimonadota bacterium]